MSASTTKKVVVYRFDRESVRGFVNPATYIQIRGVEVLNPSGNLLLIPFEEIKTVCFVKEFEATDPAGEKRTFTSRPKSAGLWVRMRFLDNDLWDGLLSNDLLGIDPAGFTVTPPDPASNNQRLYIPRKALLSLQVMAVVGSQPRPQRRPAPVSKDQIRLFD